MLQRELGLQVNLFNVACYDSVQDHAVLSVGIEQNVFHVSAERARLVQDNGFIISVQCYTATVSNDVHPEYIA